LTRTRRDLTTHRSVTLWAPSALTHAKVQLRWAEPARALGEDTLQRCRRVLGPDHSLTQYLTQAGEQQLTSCSRKMHLRIIRVGRCELHNHHQGLEPCMVRVLLRLAGSARRG
jgi:hypothetical protein